MLGVSLVHMLTTGVCFCALLCVCFFIRVLASSAHICNVATTLIALYHSYHTLNSVGGIAGVLPGAGHVFGSFDLFSTLNPSLHALYTTH
uniref:Putative secreted peptide n=1 Tax=Anopheles braziliensis TaxID=58242 RepID=A0A2M3ZW00_9DIPT